jgi:hypothetical protein
MRIKVLAGWTGATVGAGIVAVVSAAPSEALSYVGFGSEPTTTSLNVVAAQSDGRKLDDDPTIASNSSVAVQAKGFRAGERVRIVLAGSVRRDPVVRTADSRGRLTYQLVVPDGSKGAADVNFTGLGAISSAASRPGNIEAGVPRHAVFYFKTRK